MSELARFNKEGVEAHNNLRSLHGVPPLRYNEQIAKYAQEWADTLAKRNEMTHRKPNRYGENLYSMISSDPEVLASPEEACQSWYSEMEKYDFTKEPKSLATGHFTQLVWKGSKELGMGRAKAKGGMQYIVANYNPPGNVLNAFMENVPKAINKPVKPTTSPDPNLNKSQTQTQTQ